MRIENATVEHYGAYLKDKHRPPSRGGNTRAWHQHVLTISGEKYSFLACGAKKWAFLGDTVSFDWAFDESGQYRNIDSTTFEAVDKNGKPVVRGLRSSKPWRTAETRMPVSRREWKD